MTSVLEAILTVVWIGFVCWALRETQAPPWAYVLAVTFILSLSFSFINNKVQR